MVFEIFFAEHSLAPTYLPLEKFHSVPQLINIASYRFVDQQQTRANMDYLRKAIYGPTPQEQFRACQQTLRKNKRQIDRQITDLNRIQSQTKSLIKQAAKKNNKQQVKSLARELVNTKKVTTRMTTSRALLNSIELKLNEQQQLIKLNGSMQKSTVIMNDMNKIVNLPHMAKLVQGLSQELAKSGVIDEMVTDMMDFEDDELMDSEDELEIDNIINEVLGEAADKNVGSKINNVSAPSKVEEKQANAPVADEMEDDEEDELLLNMRARLSALQQ